MGQIILVTGGARSGKSSFAEKLVREKGERISYIATAQIFDEEMRFRIKLHRERRPKDWKTYEAPFHAEKALKKAVKDSDTILFDCITVYLSNLVCAKSVAELAKEDALYTEAKAKIQALIDTVKAANATVIFVTNEVGAGIVPENHLARIYRDLSGSVNQQLACASDEVYAVICGIPMQLK